jgi:hypothetical protein
VTLFAHPGHWVWQLLYLVPVVAVVGALAWAKFKERRNGDREPEV